MATEELVSKPGFEEFGKKALLIVNPVSGKKQIVKAIPQIIRCFMDAGYLVTTAVTARRGDATGYARRFGKDFDLVCCTGGDGTLNEVLSGLAAGGISVPLGYIPCGSTNDFAATRGISGDFMTAARNIASGRITRYDVGRFGERYFSYVAAFGAFSWLSYTTDQNLKNRLGHTAYILDGIKDLPKIKPIHMKLSADGVPYEGDYLFGAVCNTTSIAGTIELPKTVVDPCDGKFEILLIKVPKTIFDFDGIVRGLFTQDYSSPFIEFFQAENILIENPPGLEWSLDGECPGIQEQIRISPMPGFMLLQA